RVMDHGASTIREVCRDSRPPLDRGPGQTDLGATRDREDWDRSEASDREAVRKDFAAGHIQSDGVHRPRDAKLEPTLDVRSRGAPTELQVPDRHGDADVHPFDRTAVGI